MRTFLILGLGVLLAGSASAYGVGGFRGGAGFRGGIGFRGGTGFRGGIGFRGNFSPVFPAGFRRAPIGFGGFRRGFGFGRRGFGFRGVGYWPYSYGWYPGWYGGWGPDYSYPDYAPAAYQPNYSYSAPAPQVIVIAPMAQAPIEPRPEMREPRPEMGEYGGEPEAAGRAVSPNQVYFLLPFRDKTVQAAVAYWIEADTLHYITIAGSYRTTPLAEIDREAAAKLNKGRPIQLRLPPAKR